MRVHAKGYQVNSELVNAFSFLVSNMCAICEMQLHC